jgi:hypothetical protein
MDWTGCLKAEDSSGLWFNPGNNSPVPHRRVTIATPSRMSRKKRGKTDIDHIRVTQLAGRGHEPVISIVT